MNATSAANTPLPAALETTFGVLATTANPAAVDVLLAGLESPQLSIVAAATRALLTREEDHGVHAILGHWHALDDGCRAIALERPGRLTASLRSVIISGDSLLRKNACHAAQYLGEYDVAAALAALAESDQKASADLAAGVLVDLAQSLYEELARRSEGRPRRDPQRIRGQMLSVLEHSAARFFRHRRTEIVEALFILAPRDNASVKRILHDPHEECHATALQTLVGSTRPGVMRLALSLLDDPQPPLAALRASLARPDDAFLRHLLRKVSEGLTLQAKANLKRVQRLPWLDAPRLLNMDELTQRAALALACMSGLDRRQLLPLIRETLSGGFPAARLVAVERLGTVEGVEADGLVMNALNDADPSVRAMAVRQLRQRGTPGAVDKLIESLDALEACVREAAQHGLSDITFSKLLTTFDTLDEVSRRGAAALVRKVDPTTPARLLEELASPVRTRRLRALEMAAVMEGIDDVAEQVIELLQNDPDYLVRAAAARALAECKDPRAPQALREAALDRSVAVQQAAEAALQAVASNAAGTAACDWERVLASWNDFAEEA